MQSSPPSANLAHFASTLRFEDMPKAVIDKAEDLYVDWVGSALAGRGARPVETLARVVMQMGPALGPCEILFNGETSSPLLSGADQRRIVARG